MSVLAACGGGSGGSLPGSTPGPTTGTDGLTTPVDEQALTQIGDGFGAGDFLLPDPTVGLDSLDSYRSTLTVSFEGTQGGAPRRWMSSTVMDHRANPLLSAVMTETSGDVQTVDPRFAAVSGATFYLVGSDNQCTAELADTTTTSLLDSLTPAAALGGVMGAESIGAETIQGVEADGYHFDEGAVGLDGLADAEGEIWIARSGGYVLEYRLTATGASDLFGPDVRGTVTQEYGLGSIGQVSSVTFPSDCPAEVIDGPLPDGASDVLREPGLLAFTTSASIESTLEFYKNAANQMGWTVVSTPPSTEEAGIAEFDDRNRHLLLVAVADQGGTAVTLTEENGSLLSAATSDSQQDNAGAGTAGSGGVTMELSGGQQASLQWEFADQFSFFGAGAWTMTFQDPDNPMPNGPFLTLVLDPSGPGATFSTGTVTVVDSTGKCTLELDHQDAGGAAGRMVCKGLTGIGAGGPVDMEATFDVAT